MINPKAPPGWTQDDWDEALRQHAQAQEDRAFVARYPTRRQQERAIAAMNRAIEAGVD